MFKKYFLLIFGLVLLADFSISADNDLINNKGCDNGGYFCIFVDNRVKLSGDGSIVAPVKTIKEGQILARQLRREFSKSSIEVYIRGGRYFISEALEFSSDLDSSDFDNSIFYSGFPGEIAVISGGAEITATRKSTEDYFKADVDWKFNQIYSESMSYRNASWPQSGYSKLLNWYSVNNVNAENIDFLGRRIIVKKNNLPDVNLIGLQFDVQREFGQNIFLIKKVEYLDADDVALYFENPESDLAFSKKFPRKFGGAAFSLRGSPTFMTNSGDWIQSANGELVVFPPSGSSDLGMSLIVPKLTTLLKIKGSSQKKIKNLIFSNLHFVETTWVKPLQGFVPSQASVVYFTENGTVAIPGAIEIEYAENLKIDQCFFENIGSSAVVAKEGVYNAEITRNIFSKISASAIVMGADLKKKPEPEGVSANGKILGNFITDVGTNYYGSVGIFLGYLSGSEIAFNTLKNMPYTAISVGWGWTKELTSLHSNSIHNNYISGAMKLLSDGGGIYLVSYQPETMIYNNYISDMRLSEWATFKFFSVIYLDNGVGGVNVFDNFYNNIYSSDGERGKFFFDQKGNLGNFYSSGRNLKINSIVFGVSGIY